MKRRRFFFRRSPRQKRPAHTGKIFPGTNVETHAHHIVMKEGLGARGKKASAEAQKILRRFDIDPYWGPENMIWAPKYGHPDQMAEDVLAALKQAEKEKGTRESIVETLKAMGNKYIDGDWKVKK